MGEKEKTILEQLQENIAAIQKQLDELKAEEKADDSPSLMSFVSSLAGEDKRATTSMSKTVIAKDESDSASRIDIARESLAEAIRDEARESKRLISTSLTSIGYKDGSTYSTSSSCFENDINDIDEEALAAKLEPFTNPKRIAILKALQNEDLTATDISMKTRCVGGQLYHHLNNLGNAGLISKESDKFKLNNKTILIAVNTTACLMSNSRNDAEVFVYEDK